MASLATHNPSIPVFLTEGEAAMALRVDKRTVRRLIVSHRLRAVDLGTGRKRHRYRIDASELKAVADPVESVATPPPVGPGSPPTCSIDKFAFGVSSERLTFGHNRR